MNFKGIGNSLIEISGIDFNKIRINVDEADKLNAELYFDDVSSFDYGWIGFYSDEIDRYFSIYLEDSRLNEAVAYGSYEFNRYFPGATFELESFELNDNAGNNFYISSSDYGWDDFLGQSNISETTFEVINTLSDYDPVVVSDFSLNNTVINIDDGETKLKGQLRFEDMSGFDYGWIGFHSDEHDHEITLHLENNEYSENTAYGVENLNKYVPDGTYAMSYVELIDNAGNNLWLSRTDYGWEDFVDKNNIQDTSFEIINSSSDIDPIEILEFSLDNKTININNGEELKVALTFDDVSGFDYGWVGFYAEATDRHITLYLEDSKFDSDDIAYGSYEFNEYFVNQTFEIEHFELIDKAGNDFYISKNDNYWHQFVANTNMLNTSFEVVRNDISIIESTPGKGRLFGTNSADQFTFDLLEPSFTKKTADTIVNFDPSQGDSIKLTANAFPSLDEAEDISFISTRKKKKLKSLAKKDYDFIYFEKKGQLYYNGNGIGKGWGSKDEGGIIAILKGKPSLSSEDLIFG